MGLLLIFIVIFHVSHAFGAEEMLPSFQEVILSEEDSFESEHWNFFKIHGQQASLLNPFATEQASQPIQEEPINYTYLRDGTLKTQAIVRVWGTTNAHPEPRPIVTPVTLHWDQAGRKISQHWHHEIQSIFCDYKYHEINFKVRVKRTPHGVTCISQKGEEPETIRILQNIHPEQSYKKIHPGSLALDPTEPLCGFAIDKNMVQLTSLDPEKESDRPIHLKVPHTATCPRELGPDKLLLNHSCMATEIHGEVLLISLQEMTSQKLSEPFVQFKAENETISEREQCQKYQDTVINFNPLKKQFMIQRAGKIKLFDITQKKARSVFQKTDTVQGCADFTATGDYLVLGAKNDQTDNYFMLIDTQACRPTVRTHYFAVLKELKCDPYSSENTFAFCTEKDFYVVFNPDKNLKMFHRKGTDFSHIQWHPLWLSVSVIDENQLKTWNFSANNELINYMSSISQKPENFLQRALFHKLYKECHRSDRPFFISNNPDPDQIFQKSIKTLPANIIRILEKATLIRRESDPRREPLQIPPRLSRTHIIEEDEFLYPDTEELPSYEASFDQSSRERNITSSGEESAVAQRTSRFKFWTPVIAAFRRFYH